MIEIEIIKKAKKLFKKTRSPSQQVLTSKFGSLHATILLLPKQVHKSNNLYRRILLNINNRRADLFFRLDLINWLHKKFKGKICKDRRDWNIFAALAIKDFHIDLSSLMDSLAPFIIQLSCGLKKEDQNKFPGFADIQEKTKRSYREQMSEELLKIIDSTNRWWPQIKQIRDVLAHREHHKIVFAQACDGVLFQIYGNKMNPKIIDKKVLCKHGHNVVNFYLYSAYINSELLMFMEDVAEYGRIAIKIGENSLTNSYRIGDFRTLLSGMNSLIKNT